MERDKSVSSEAKENEQQPERGSVPYGHKRHGKLAKSGFTGGKYFPIKTITFLPGEERPL